jgi:hypothetical protein
MISDRFIRSVTGSPRVASLAGDLIRVLTWALALLVTAGAIGDYLPLSVRVLHATHFNDFGRFFYATAAYRAGHDMYAPSPATPVVLTGSVTVQLLDLNPPLFHALLLPLVRLPVAQAFILWALASVICLGASLFVVARELRVQRTTNGMALVVVGLVASSATLATVVTGQITFVLLLPLTIAWQEARRGHWTAAACWLGGLASIKLFVGVFALAFLAARRWRALIVMAAAAAVGFAIGLLAFGLPAYLSWTRALASVSWPWLPMNASAAGLLSRAFDGGPVFAPLVLAPSVARWCGMAVSLALVAATGLTIARDRRPGAVDRTFLGVTLLAVLASPLGWVYYLWLAVGPATAVWLADRETQSPLRDRLVLLAVPGLFVPIAFTLIDARMAWMGVSLGSVYAWSTILLWAATIVDARART